MNDPYTAVQAIQHLSVIMAELAVVATDDITEEAGGRTVVFVPVADFGLFLDTLCGNIRRSAADRPRVMVALLRLLETVAASHTSDRRRRLVAQQVELVRAAVERVIEPASDLEPIMAMADDAAFAAEYGYVDHG